MMTDSSHSKKLHRIRVPIHGGRWDGLWIEIDPHAPGGYIKAHVEMLDIMAGTPREWRANPGVAVFQLDHDRLIPVAIHENP